MKLTSPTLERLYTIRTDIEQILETASLDADVDVDATELSVHYKLLSALDTVQKAIKAHFKTLLLG